MNILILSAGTRNKIVGAFKKELAGEGSVIATDCSDAAPALYAADRAYIVPRITEPGYIDRILEICKKEKADAVFSLIDPELSLIAKERERFEEVGTKVIVSSYELCETCLDKYSMYRLLKSKGIATIDTYLSKEDFFEAKSRGEARYPVFVKPRYGSASLNISTADSDAAVENLMGQIPDLMIQEKMTGDEYGCDVYVDLISGKCTGIFLKKKIRMRAGETDKSVSVHDEEVMSMAASFAEQCGFRGMIDIDLFLQDGVWYLSEVNPRFGGGYPHAYACGVNFPAMLIKNLKGQENEPCDCGYEDGIYMMKYNEIMIVREKDLIR